ncbi:hypothetical protein Tco_1503540 [Tanacetum coccineum]
MTQRTILVAQAAYFLNLLRKFMMSPMIEEYKPRSTETEVVVARNKMVYVQTNLTLVHLLNSRLRSMMVFPIHQEDLHSNELHSLTQLSQWFTEKTASHRTPPTTQAHVQSVSSTSCWKYISRGDLEVQLVKVDHDRPKVTTSLEARTITTRMIKIYCGLDDRQRKLKDHTSPKEQCSKITTCRTK